MVKTSESQLDNRRIMKNSMMLYLRTLLTMAIGLYNSRVVLQVLGFDDFGIYSVVGSVVVMFGFFTSSISSSISRFISFELAGGDRDRLKATFNAGMVIVLCLAAIIIVLAETLGLWLFSRLNLPEGSRTAAMWVYQLSVVTAIINLLQTSYISTIIAHERMGAFALIDIVNSSLKLGAVFLLELVMFNKLELYSFLIMCVMMLVTTGTAIYCRRNFAECRIDLRPDPAVIKPMLSFSGWSLFKTGCDTLRPTGVNVIINLFFGVALNAAVGVAMNVSSNTAKFIANVFVAFKPQIIKAYSLREFGNMQSLLTNALRMSLAMQLLLSVPLIIEMPYVLEIWLGEYPAYAVVFCRLLLVSMFFEVIIAIIEFGINATGHIRLFSIVNGLLTVSTVAVGWIAFRLGAAPEAVYIAQICASAACVVGAMLIEKALVPELSMTRLVWIYVRVAVVALAAYAVGMAVESAMSAGGFMRFIAVCGATTALGAAGIWTLILTPAAKQALRSKLRR